MNVGRKLAHFGEESGGHWSEVTSLHIRIRNRFYPPNFSTSVRAMQYELIRPDLAKSCQRTLLFDTHAMIQVLEQSGFTTQQAEIIVKVLLNTTNANMDIMYSDMVTKTQQEIMVQKIMSHIAALKKDMIILEKSEFSELLSENEKIKIDLAQVKMQLSDMMNKVRLDNKLDVNMEKSQVKEMRAEHEKKILETRNKIMEMLSEQDRHVTQSNVKIDTEVAGLKTMLESHKLDSIKYLAGAEGNPALESVMAEVFSSKSETVLQRSVDVNLTDLAPRPDDLQEFYQINETCSFITDNNFKQVALQFPDELLVDCVAVSSAIERKTQAKTYILGDTTYGSCCVDEVAAEHVRADCIVHYGRACLSPSRRLPLMYVFGKRTINVQECARAFRELYPDQETHVIILYDVTYSHAIDDFQRLLGDTYPNAVFSVLRGDHSHGQVYEPLRLANNSNLQDDGFVHKFGRQFGLKQGKNVEDYKMFYVGPEGLTLTNFMMTWNRCAFSSFNPDTLTGRAESININRALMKRYYAIERAKDANVVGILVGTLGVANYLNIIEQLKESIHRAGKKSYMFAMGKINVPKLANFLEIDVYVLVACPENSLLDSSEFYRPVVTPFEMEVACNKHREWSGEYVTDFQDLLPGGSSHVEFPDSDQSANDDSTDVSLITGALRTSCLRSSSKSTDVSPSSSSVMIRNQTLTVANTNTAASFLAGRSWQGLEPKLGETPVVKAVEGRRGIAIAYEEEGTHSKDCLT
ncbi:2-(3-amino-3-carboxypropyl)histidine synthase subunit 2 [Bagarius yarrelli]|uniref:2-(3-amino-3-carboxypropyl)histidine synthase subunit 2 n=1 Tax=Bagarius yarrelli TaxID=175774 RepID=A0A556TYU7_BAGYA|nr:2-(3-amino-3-carboxypropyl)histidine synthase subunit 2 [Bagarius yarrelli]